MHCFRLWLAKKSGKPVERCQEVWGLFLRFFHWLRSLETQLKDSKTNLNKRLFIAKRIECLRVVVVVYFFRRRRRENSDTALDDRDDFSNGRPVRMKKVNRKRRSPQKKRLMGSTESLTGLDELAASRASEVYNLTSVVCDCCITCMGFKFTFVWKSLTVCFLLEKRSRKRVASLKFAIANFTALWNFLGTCLHV